MVPVHNRCIPTSRRIDGFSQLLRLRNDSFKNVGPSQKMPEFPLTRR